MGESARLLLADIERAIAARDPQLGELIVRYLEQDDPDPGQTELDPHFNEEDETAVEPDVPAGAYTFDRLQREVSEYGLRGKNPTERKLARREAFAAAESSPFAPPRLRLGKILVDLYEAGDPAGRGALLHVFANAKLKWGVWYAAKHIFKRVEETRDPALFGVLAFRFDALPSTPRQEIGMGTIIYLRRRAWRWLRKLGAAVPDAYPTYAVEVLRHYPASYGQHQGSWVAPHIFAHGTMRYARDTWPFYPGNIDPAKRAFPHAWKVSPTPLLRLLESALNELVVTFAIMSLRADHPLALRAVEPAWLAQLGRRQMGAIHAFVVQLLRESPELHQSKLRGLGLHDTVLSFLRSPSPEARQYALEYAAANAPDIAVGELVELVERGAPEVQKFAAARLETMTPQQLGAGVLIRLLGVAAAPWAAAKLAQGFSPRDIDAQMFIDAAVRGPNAYNALVKFFNDKGAAVPAAFYTRLLDDPRMGPANYAARGIVTTVMAELAKRSAREIGIEWIQKSFEDRNRTTYVAQWLQNGMLAGPDLDVDWVKSLVAKPRLRPTALRLLADRRYVEPARVGLSWLLELARSSDNELAQFAQRMLLESFTPDDFGGVARVWELATGKKQPEAVRTFAATYLKAHHPELGPRLPEAKALGIKPRLRPEDYALPMIRSLARDDRADVRRLAVAIAAEDIVRWNDADFVYELATSNHKEPRALGIELLMGAITEGATRRVPAAWIDGRRLFQLAESPQKASREVALTLIRRLYDGVGGAERLAWLMDSPDRDVRLFAVRLFWDRHRPKPWPDDYIPRKNVGAPIGTHRFTDLNALRQFARVVLFGLPPGRVGERDALMPGAPQPERPLPASIAKRRLIEAMRDIGLEDIEFARAIAPVLGEFTESTAKGEWQASLQALTALRAKHGKEVLP
ncbi:MAG TPA: hypothetical protein VM509_15605 [Planctomycetota bacterium]|nr:hypothetical protein [Planctomycetota bacterium]